MCEDICVYIFGYGSLIWRPGFPYLRKFDGYIKGWRRGFWQGSTDHRGTPEYPGRVVTLVKDPHAVTWGTVYCIPDEEAAAILRNLDYREKNGYIREEIDVFITGREGPVVTKSILYVAAEHNTSFLGESPLVDIATQSIGPSGPNVDYLLNLAESMRKMSAEDPHVFELEQIVVNLVRTAPLSHHTHSALQALHKGPPLESLTVQTVTITVSTSTTTTTSTPPTTSNRNSCEYTTDQSVPVINVDSVCTEKSTSTVEDVIDHHEDMQRKYFLAPSATVKGVICIDSGAMMAVSQRGRSLLAAGIVRVNGQFDHNELISIIDSTGTEHLRPIYVARGITTYSSEEILKFKGLHSTKIVQVLGFTRGDAVVHSQNMILV